MGAAGSRELNSRFSANPPAVFSPWFSAAPLLQRPRRLTKGPPVSTALDARHGSDLWKFNRFRSLVLVGLLDDLSLHGDSGISDAHCREIRDGLSRITNAATELPDGAFLRRSVWQEFARMEDLYDRWNAVDGDSPQARFERKTLLRKLRKRRHAIANRVRRNQFRIAEELDLAFLKAVYEASGAMVKALPELLTNLARALNRISG